MNAGAGNQFPLDLIKTLKISERYRFKIESHSQLASEKINRALQQGLP